MLTAPSPRIPRVLLSYAHETDGGAHADRVLDVSDRLRADGVDAILDQYEPYPAEGWPRWMERQIREADFVLMVCTETYYRRVVGQEQPGVGLGVRWEGGLIYNALYHNGAVDPRFVPVVFRAEDARFIPDPVQGFTFYVLPGDYERLYRHLTNQPEVTRGPLGPIRPLPRRSGRSGPAPNGAPAPGPARPPEEEAMAGRTPASTAASGAFVRFYAKAVADAVYLTHFLGDYGKDDLDAALTGLLKMARSVAAAYYGHPGGPEINASVMVAVPIRSRRRADYPGLVFTGPRWTPDAYQGVLLLRQWAEQSNRVPQDVALPVHRSPPRVLFGAPRAFLSGQVQAVGDVKDPEELTRLLDSQSEAVAAEIRDYMAQAPFRSFVSWCLPYRDRPVGVLNIQSGEPNMFGDGSRYGDEIAVFLQPLCYVLGLVIAALGLG